MRCYDQVSSEHPFNDVLSAVSMEEIMRKLTGFAFATAISLALWGLTQEISSVNSLAR
jgi:hypothetical protein